jgi:bifunctional non-homologous end joining protein LigD
MRPMLATRGSTVPDSPEWLHEVKWDGMRVLVSVHDETVRLLSRNENDVTVSFPELASLAGDPGCRGQDLLLDGEIVAFTDGRPVFGALADRMHVKSVRKAEAAAARNPVTLMAFDLLSLDGRDLTGLPLVGRRALLEGLCLDGAHWKVPPVYDDGDILLEATRAQGLEGIVSKRRSSRYVFGRRCEDWLKFPHRPSGSYVVGGWRPETGTKNRLGALLVGEVTPDGLAFRGRVGSGVTGKAAVRLKELLDPITSDEHPFTGTVPREDAVGAVWVSPSVVVEVASLGFTPQHRLRQPSYVGLRTDVRPEDLQDLGGGEDG